MKSSFTLTAYPRASVCRNASQVVRLALQVPVFCESYVGGSVRLHDNWQLHSLMVGECAETAYDFGRRGFRKPRRDPNIRQEWLPRRKTNATETVDDEASKRFRVQG